MSVRAIITIPLEIEDDIVHARQCARIVAERLGFAGQDQTRIATALSEIARNAFGYAGGGRIDFELSMDALTKLMVRVADKGTGIPELQTVLSGNYVSRTGMGLGIVGCRRLMDTFEIASTSRGTTVIMSKTLPGAARPTPERLVEIADAVRAMRTADRSAAARDENRDLVESLAALAEREEETRRLNAELEETNRGVVALHAELELQADQLRLAGETLERQVAERTRELAEANELLRAEAVAREQAEADLRQSQKMEAVGQLTGGIAHDFNNLLAGVVGALDMIGRRLKQGRHEKLETYIDMAMASANRAAALTHRLLAFARRQPLDPRVVDVNKLIEGMDDLLRRTVNESVELRLALAPDAWLTLCDPFQLENAILNLTINARDAMPAGGSIIVTTRNEDGAKRGHGLATPHVVVSVVDNGTGMPPEVVARAFDPFFTTKPLGKGTGLGLSMIYGFAKQSEGDAVIASIPGKGTTISLLLPRFCGEADTTEAIADIDAPLGARGETVLLVEDETTVRELLQDALTEVGYRVIHAKDGMEGLAVARAAQRIDLLITDVGLPSLNGRQLADAIRVARPGLKVIFITGYAEAVASPAGALEPGMAIVTKPFVLDTLIGRVRDLMDSH